MTAFLHRIGTCTTAVITTLALVGCGASDSTDSPGTPEGAQSGSSAADANKGAAASGDLEVSGAWIPEPANPDTAAGYLTVENSGDRDDALVGAETPAAGMTQVHTTVTTDSGAQQMRSVERVPVPAGGELVLESGGYHLMLMETPEDLSPGDTVALTLHFDSGTDVGVEVPVLERR